MIGIVVSRADHASTHIGEQLLDLRAWDEQEDETRPDAEGGGTYYRLDGAELREFDELHIYMDDPVPAFSAPASIDLVVFVSRHSGNTGPLLTAHFTGNFGPAEFGGETGRFARAAPGAQWAIVRAFDRYAPDGYGVGIECTHHGPTAVSAPSMFAEVGSDEKQWRDPAAARAVANAVLSLLQDDADEWDRKRRIVGFGGGHYAPRFERILRETDWAIGHIGADWALEAMASAAAPDETTEGDGSDQSASDRREVIERAFEASGADRAVVEGDRPALERTIADLGYDVVSETWLRAVGDRPLSIVERVESELSSVEAGLRFGSIRVDDPSGTTDGAELEYVALPAALLEEACGIDGEAAYEAVEANTVAFETEEGATKPVGRAAIVEKTSERSPYDAIVDALAAILREKYDEVTRRDGRVIATAVGFDPELAVDLGVPEGPVFGTLAAGEPVEIDGRRIDPADVRSERRVEFEY